MGRVWAKWMLLGAICATGCQKPAPPPDIMSAPISMAPTTVLVQNMHPSPDRPGTVVGDWQADVHARGARAPVQLNVRRNNADPSAIDPSWRSDTAIEGLPASGAVGPAHFGLTRASGLLTFDGAADGANAHGIVRFEPEPAYSSEIVRMYGPVSPERLFDLAVAGFELNYGQALYDANYRFTMDEALLLYRTGVASDYAIELRKSGYELSSGDIVQLHDGGVSSGYARQIRQGGLQLSAQELILLNHSGIGVDYAVAVRQAGAAPTVSDVVFLQHNGVSADDVRAVAAAGYKFDASDFVKLHKAGVGATYVVDIKRAGYNLTADEIIRLQHAGVEVDYAAALIAPGHENLGVEDIIELHQRGVSADTIRKLRK